MTGKDSKYNTGLHTINTQQLATQTISLLRSEKSPFEKKNDIPIVFIRDEETEPRIKETKRVVYKEAKEEEKSREESKKEKTSLLKKVGLVIGVGLASIATIGYLSAGLIKNFILNINYYQTLWYVVDVEIGVITILLAVEVLNLLKKIF